MSQNLAIAEKARDRGREIAVMIDAKIQETGILCAAFGSDDPDALRAYLQLPEGTDRAAAEAVGWKALLTWRLEIDGSTAGLSSALGPAFRAFQAAHAQRDVALNAVEQVAAECKALLYEYAQKAAWAGEGACRLLEAQGIELDLPEEQRRARSQIVAPGTPIPSAYPA